MKDRSQIYKISMHTKLLICCNVCIFVQTIPHCTISPMAVPIAINTTANGAKRFKYHKSLIDDLKIKIKQYRNIQKIYILNYIITVIQSYTIIRVKTFSILFHSIFLRILFRNIIFPFSFRTIFRSISLINLKY